MKNLVSNKMKGHHVNLILSDIETDQWDQESSPHACAHTPEEFEIRVIPADKIDFPTLPNRLNWKQDCTQYCGDDHKQLESPKPSDYIAVNLDKPIDQALTPGQTLNVTRPGSRALSFNSHGIKEGASLTSMYNRYIQEDGVLKSVQRRDFYCATIWFPFFLQEYYPDFSKFKQFLLSLLVYSYFLFVAIASNIFTMLVFSEMTGDFRDRCLDNNSIGYRSFFKTFASLLASVLFVLNLITELKLSIDPLIFWWKVVQFGDWDFEIKKNDDSSVELIRIQAPALNCILRLIIVSSVQILSNFNLFVVGLLAIQSSQGFSDLVKDCLAFIWISQIDEIVFQYLFLINPYFKNLWRDGIFDETVYLFRDESIKKRQTKTIPTIIKNIFSSLIGIGLIVILFDVISKRLINAYYCNSGIQTSSLTPPGSIDRI